MGGPDYPAMVLRDKAAARFQSRPVPDGQQDVVDRALRVHQEKWPVTGHFQRSGNF
jgi:hypothetical protein